MAGAPAPQAKNRQFVVLISTATSVAASSSLQVSAPPIVIPIPRAPAHIHVWHLEAGVNAADTSGKLTIASIRPTIAWLRPDGSTIATMEPPRDFDFVAANPLPALTNTLYSAISRPFTLYASDQISNQGNSGLATQLALGAVALIANTDGAGAHSAQVVVKALFEIDSALPVHVEE